jgi:hypothetical protein
MLRRFNSHDGSCTSALRRGEGKILGHVNILLWGEEVGLLDLAFC